MTKPAVATATLVLFWLPVLVLAHNVSQNNANFVETISGPAVVPFLYLGAKHMTTGYDHLLYLVGVVFFLYRAREILLYVTLFSMSTSSSISGTTVRLANAVCRRACESKGEMRTSRWTPCSEFR